MIAVATASQAVIVWGAGGNIPDNNTGGLTSGIALGLGGTLNGIVFEGLTHTWAGDVKATVDGGIGSLFTQVGRVGSGFGDSSDFGGNYVFANGGADIWAEAAVGTGLYVIRSGTYAATGADSATALVLPASVSAGTYTLTISDLAGGDTGGFTRWGIDYTPVPEPGTIAALGLGAIVLLRRKRK